MARTFLDWAFEGRSSKWLYLVGSLLLILVMKFALIPLALITTFVADSTQWPVAAAYFYDRLPLFVMIAIVPLWVHFAHKRPWWSVAAPRPQIEWWNLGVGGLFGLITVIVIAGIHSAFFGQTTIFGTPDMAAYWPALVFGFFYVFMQTTFEELIFRGYGMQAARRFTASPVAMVLITAILFAIPHYDNIVFGGRPWWAVFTYMVPAIMFGWLVLRTGSLWMPIGWHWVNNFILTRVYIVEGDITTGRDAFVHSFGPPPEAVGLVTQIVVFSTMAVFVNYLMSRHEARQGEGEAAPAT